MTALEGFDKKWSDFPDYIIGITREIWEQTAIVQQLGIEPMQYARELIDREGGIEQCVKPLTPSIDIQGAYTGRAYTGRGNDDPWGQRYADTLTRNRFGSGCVAGSCIEEADRVLKI